MTADSYYSRHGCDCLEGIQGYCHQILESFMILRYSFKKSLFLKCEVPT